MLGTAPRAERDVADINHATPLRLLDSVSADPLFVASHSRPQDVARALIARLVHAARQDMAAVGADAVLQAVQAINLAFGTVLTGGGVLFTYPALWQRVTGETALHMVWFACVRRPFPIMPSRTEGRTVDLHVAARTSPARLAGAITALTQNNNNIHVCAVGAGALNQAVKGVALAGIFLSEQSLRLGMIPYRVRPLGPAQPGPPAFRLVLTVERALQTQQERRRPEILTASRVHER